MTRYKVFAGACLTQFIVIGFLFSYGVFFSAFETEFGWSRTLLSSCSALAFFVMGVLAIIAGRLSDRYGPRLVLGFTGLMYGLGCVLMSQITQQWQLLMIFVVFIGLGMGTHDVVTLSTVARWFPKGRGFITGLVKLGTAAGQMILPPIAAFLILSYGWRRSLVILGLLAALSLLAAAVLMSRPENEKPTAAQAKLATASFQDAKRSLTFKKLCLIQFLFFPTLMTIPTHIAVYGMDMGMTGARAALLLTVIGAASMAGRLATGYFQDRLGSQAAYSACFIPILISLNALLLWDNHSALFLFMALYGFGHGGFFSVVSPTVAEYFGMQSHGALFGIILFFGTIGGAIGPILAGMVFDYSGNYDSAFITLALLMALGLILVLTLPKTQATAA